MKSMKDLKIKGNGSVANAYLLYAPSNNHAFTAMLNELGDFNSNWMFGPRLLDFCQHTLARTSWRAKEK